MTDYQKMDGGQVRSSQEYKTDKIDSILHFGTFAIYLGFGGMLSRNVLWKIDFEKALQRTEQYVPTHSIYMEIWIYAWVKAISFLDEHIQGALDGLWRSFCSPKL